ncbi:MAG: hypothetical protein WAU32_08080, partial [Thermoanaerobaculia bacterium]
MRRSLCARGAGIFLLAATHCARRIPQPAELPPQAPTPTPIARVTTLADVEPALLQMEDRRDLVEPVIEAAAAAADPAVRARTALAIGRIGDDRGRAPLARFLG